MGITLFALARGDDTTRAVIDRLRTVGISTEQLSVMYPDPKARNAAAAEAAANEGAPAHPTAAEGVVGGAVGVGLLMGIGALGLPGIGPFLAAGPVLAALTVPNAGATLGALATWLTGFGIAEPEAQRFEGSMGEGTALIAVHGLSVGDVPRVRDIFARAGVTDILQANDAPDLDVVTPERADVPLADANHGGA